jgi:hypothetical protein
MAIRAKVCGRLGGDVCLGGGRKKCRSFNALAAASQSPVGYRGDFAAFMIERAKRTAAP